MIHQLYSYEIKEKLWPLDISSLFSVGKKTQNILRKLQINTIGDLALSNPKNLEKKLGKNGIEIWKLANGIDESEVIPITEQPKSISHSETLASNLSNIETIKKEILKLTEFVCERLRKEKLFCKTIRLTLRDKNFKDKSKQKSLNTYTDNTNIIYSTVLEILNEINIKKEIRLIGITLDNLKSNTDEQLDLFSLEKENEKKNKRKKKTSSKIIKEEKLDYVLDNINKKYDKNIIKRARNIKKEE